MADTAKNELAITRETSILDSLVTWGDYYQLANESAGLRREILSGSFGPEISATPNPAMERTAKLLVTTILEQSDVRRALEAPLQIPFEIEA